MAYFSAVSRIHVEILSIIIENLRQKADNLSEIRMRYIRNTAEERDSYTNHLTLACLREIPYETAELYNPTHLTINHYIFSNR